MLARQRERGIDVGSSISAATGALGGGSLDNPHGWLWLFGRVRLPICAASPAP